MKRDLVFVAFVFSILAVGAFVSYAHNPFSASLEAEIDGDRISFDISSNYGSGFTAVSIKNDKELGTRNYFVYRDWEYGTPIQGIDYAESMDSLERSLRVSCGISLGYLDSAGLKTLIDEEMSQSVFNAAVIFLTGAAPDTVYNGTADSPLIKWMRAGGIVYWGGQPFGKYFSTPDGVKMVPGYSAALFGKVGVFRDDLDLPLYSRNPIDENDNVALSIHYNNVTYGIDTSKISGKSFSVGYRFGNFHSLSFIEMGNGMLAYFGGYLYKDDAQNLVLALSFRLNQTSEVVEYQKGLVKGGHGHGQMVIDRSNTTMVVYLGDFKVNKVWALFPENGSFV